MITLKSTEREVVKDIEHCLKDMFELEDVKVLSLRELPYEIHKKLLKDGYVIEYAVGTGGVNIYW